MRNRADKSRNGSNPHQRVVELRMVGDCRRRIPQNQERREFSVASFSRVHYKDSNRIKRYYSSERSYRTLVATQLV